MISAVRGGLGFLLSFLGGLLLSWLWLRIKAIGFSDTDDPDGHVVLPVFEFAICGRRIRPSGQPMWNDELSSSGGHRSMCGPLLMQDQNLKLFRTCKWPIRNGYRAGRACFRHFAYGTILAFSKLWLREYYTDRFCAHSEVLNQFPEFDCKSLQSDTILPAVNLEGGTMGNLSSGLSQ